VTEARGGGGREAGGGRRFSSVAPDMPDVGLGGVIEIAVARGVEGLIISNTTVARPRLKFRRHADELGGLSGRPLFELSTAMLARARQLAGPDMVLVGAGGVDSGAAAWSKIAAGADLVQLYTGMIYEGPMLPKRIVVELLQRLEGATSPISARCAASRRIAGRRLALR
jgi:dihydroorotate dehydrogenase